MARLVRLTLMLLLCYRALDGLADRVELHPGIAITNLAEVELERAGSTEVGDGHTLDLFRGRGPLQGL